MLRWSREGTLPLGRRVLLQGGHAQPQAPDTYLKPAVQTGEVTVGPKGSLEGMQEQGDVGAVGRMAGRAQLVGHGEELCLHLHGVQQQHGARGAEERLWAQEAQPSTSPGCAALRPGLLQPRQGLRPGEGVGAPGAQIPKFRVHLSIFHPVFSKAF